jgi:hypothetical protein
VSAGVGAPPAPPEVGFDADPVAALDAFAELTADRAAAPAAAPVVVRWGRFRAARVTGVLVLAGYTLLSVALFHGAWGRPSVRLIGSCCDQPPAVDLLRWTGFALSHGQNPFFTPYLAVPHGVNVVAQPNGMPLLGLAAWPVEALFGPVVAYNVVVTVGVALSAFAASPFVLTHALGHPNVMFAPVPPLFLLVLGDLLVTGRRRPWVSGILLGLLAAAQLLIGPEVLAGVALASVLVVVTLLVVRRSTLVRRVRAILAGLGVAAATGLAVAAWPLVEVLAGSQRLSGHFETLTIGTDVANYLFPGLASQFRPGGGQYATTWHLALGEAGATLGPVLILLCVATAVWQWRLLVVKVATVVGVGMGVLALGPDLTVAGTHDAVWLPTRLLLHVPLLQNMIPARLQLFTVLAMAVLVAVFVRQAVAGVHRTPAGPRRRWLALVPLVPNVAYPAQVYAQPRFFTTDAVDVLPAGSAAFVVPYPQGGPDDGSAMLWQAQSDFRFRMAGGYVFVPGPHGAQLAGDPTLLTALLGAIEAGQPLPPLGPAQRAAMRADLRSLGVTSVVLGPTPGRARAQHLLSWVIGSHPVRRDGVALWPGPIP